MPRRMADAQFRREQERDRYAPHVRPVNTYVDELRSAGRGWVPHVAPWHGGTRARILSVLRDPGPMVREGTGSGFLCIENDDPTAENQARSFACVGIEPSDITPWNAYPWYINRAPATAELRLGLDPLARLLDLLDQVGVVLLQGKDAQRSWRLFERRFPTLVKDRHLTVLPTYHPSPQALFTPDPVVRHARSQHRKAAYVSAARAIGLVVDEAVVASRWRGPSAPPARGSRG